MNDARFPWLILVPKVSGLRELHDLSPDERSQLMDEIPSASQVLEKLYTLDKINVGALGYIVEQLHMGLSQIMPMRCYHGRYEEEPSQQA